VIDDKASFEEYQEACKENITVVGEGADKVTWFPCPGCTTAGWKGVSITIGLDDPELREPSQCLACERMFRFEVKKTENGVEGCVVLLSGKKMPPYLPEAIQFL